MPDNCRHWQALLAEQVLAARSPAGERAGDAETSADLAEHLADCVECRAIAEEFRSTAAALSGTTAPSATPVLMPTSDDLSMRITARVESERRRRDRRRHRMIAASAAAALLIGISFVALRQSTSDDNISDRVALSAPGVEGDVTLQPQEWGSEIHLAITGVTPGQRYNVWLERADGSRVGAGTFIGVRHNEINVALASALPPSEAIAIGISIPDGDTVVRTPLD